jgi:hypothetical protein
MSLNDYDACKALLKIMDEAYGAPVVTSFPEDEPQEKQNQLQEGYGYGPEVMPGAQGVDSDDETFVSYTKTKRDGDASVTVTANAKSMDELHKVLALAGLDPSGADKYVQPEEPNDAEQEEPECGCDAPDMSYSTDKAALVDMIKQKLQQKLG